MGFKLLVFFLVRNAQLRCRVVVVAKLKHCRVPSCKIFYISKHTGGGGGGTMIQNTSYSPVEWVVIRAKLCTELKALQYKKLSL